MYRFFIPGLMLLLTACAGNRTAQSAAEVVFRGDTVVVSSNSPIYGQMEFATVEPCGYSARFRTVGEVTPVAGRIAEISAPFSGRVEGCSVHLGQKVKKGTPVFTLGSSGFYEAVRSYFAAKANNELAAGRYARQSALSRNGVGAVRDLEQARSEAYIAAQELEQATAVLRIFNADTASLRMGQPLVSVSPIAGEVLSFDMTIGSYVSEGDGPLAVVADLSTVWVRAFVKERYFGAVQEGDSVEIHVPSAPELTYEGRVHYVGEMVDPESRALEVIVECDNAARSLKLGMFCNVLFFSSPVESFILPATALMQESGSDFVYQSLGDGTLLRKPVVSETLGDGNVRILSGLEGGETVMTRGGIFLNM